MRKVIPCPINPTIIKTFHANNNVFHSPAKQHHQDGICNKNLCEADKKGCETDTNAGFRRLQSGCGDAATRHVQKSSQRFRAVVFSLLTMISASGYPAITTFILRLNHVLSRSTLAMWTMCRRLARKKAAGSS